MTDRPGHHPPLAPSTELVLAAPARLVAARPEGDAVTAVALWAGPAAADETLSFLTATIRNPNTRRAYHRAVSRFVAWCAQRSIDIRHVTAPAVAAHIDELKRSMQPPSVTLHLSALRHWFDKLVLGHVLPYNPAHAVRGERQSKTRGKTPVFDARDAKQLFVSIDASTLRGARDRALMGIMLYSFGRIGAVLKMAVRDYAGRGTSGPTFVLHEKGGRFHRVAAHHKACEYLDAYIALAGFGQQPSAALWQGLRQGKLSGKRLTQDRACEVVKERCRAAALPDEFCNHSFRATGITIFRKRGGDLATAQRMAAHADIRTTRIYDHSDAEIERAEVETVQL